MNDPAGNPQGRRHSLADWLALHELDPPGCRRILDAIAWQAAGEPAAHARPNPGDRALDLELAWLGIVEAMRDFLPGCQGIIDDTFEKTARIVVDRRDNSRKALTLDNGPTAYPTILFSYRGEPADCLVMAHEFGHALQIRASRGNFVPPVMREVCAFLGEGALLSHALHRGAAHHADLAHVWRADSDRYFGVQRTRLKAALSRPSTPYKYSWNYPIARHLAIQIAERFSRDRIWSVFEGGASVQDVLRELALSPGQRGTDARPGYRTLPR